MASPPPRFFMYSGAAFPPPEALLACPALRRMAPLAEPMAQFYSELGVHRLLRSHPARTADPAVAELFYVPWCPHLDQDAGRCNKTNHRGRAEGVATAAAVVQLAKRYRVHLPVLTAVASILDGHMDAKTAVDKIMNLPQVPEV